jgi:hypothetical protein
VTVAIAAGAGAEQDDPGGRRRLTQSTTSLGYDGLVDHQVNGTGPVEQSPAIGSQLSQTAVAESLWSAVDMTKCERARRQ